MLPRGQSRPLNFRHETGAVTDWPAPIMVNRVLMTGRQHGAMRRIAALALVLLLATPAGAQGGRVSPPTAAEVGLKGGEPAAAAPEAPLLDFSVQNRQTGLPAGLAFTRPLASTASGSAASVNAGQCRGRCAQSRYFCLAEAEEETCSPQWARCVAGCS